MSNDTFEIGDLVTKISSANFRKERHGEVLIAAVDIGFEVSANEQITRVMMGSLFGGDATIRSCAIGCAGLRSTSL